MKRKRSEPIPEGYIAPSPIHSIIHAQMKEAILHYSGHCSLPEIAAIMAQLIGVVSVIDENGADFLDIMTTNFNNGRVGGGLLAKAAESRVQ